MTKAILKCECGYETPVDVETQTDENGVKQPVWPTTLDWTCPECGRALYWDGMLE